MKKSTCFLFVTSVVLVGGLSFSSHISYAYNDSLDFTAITPLNDSGKPIRPYKDGDIISQSDTLAETPILSVNEPVDLSTVGDAPTSKEKAIIDFYPTLKAIPDIHSYEEYSNDHWYKGKLYLETIVLHGSGYNVLYKGVLNRSK